MAFCQSVGYFLGEELKNDFLALIPFPLLEWIMSASPKLLLVNIEVFYRCLFSEYFGICLCTLAI